MQIYIGKFNTDISQDHLKKRLEQYGKVKSLRIENRMAFAEMPLEDEAESAIMNLDKSQLEGIVLSVHKARYGSTDRRKSGRIGGRRSQDPKSYTSMFTRKEIFFE